jgi:hypothetical protein
MFDICISRAGESIFALRIITERGVVVRVFISNHLYRDEL